MPLALYVHFPWCLQKCPYCDFATEPVAPRDVPHKRYAEAVTAELALRRDAFASERLGTVFFGGGTPSLWEPAELGRVLRAAQDVFGPPDEVTVECNPNSLTEERARALIDQGVTRLSVGVQSLRDPHLRYLGRMHDAQEALRAVRAVAKLKDLRVSADLMFGMPEQREDELLEDAARLVDAGVEHVSAYALTIEPATRFGELARKGRLPRLPEEGVARLFEALAGAMRRAGWGHYEVSNYARPGAEARHNMAYWRGEAYVGLGAGAVGCWREGVGRAVRYRNDAAPEAYMAALAKGVLPPDEREELDGETLVREGLMLGLRTSEGLDVRRLAERSGVDVRATRERALAREVARGNVVDEGERWRIPRERWLMADGIVAAMF